MGGALDNCQVGPPIILARHCSVALKPRCPRARESRSNKFKTFCLHPALIAVAAVDYYLARRKITGQMKMSTAELKREHKEQEGDPQVKGKRRQKMKELAKRRMSAAVAKADVVIVNPTHYAVAIAYNASMRAPRVVAKGSALIAFRIREIGNAHRLPILAAPPLARPHSTHPDRGR